MLDIDVYHIVKPYRIGAEGSESIELPSQSAITELGHAWDAFKKELEVSQ
jgi:hypothetical protein